MTRNRDHVRPPHHRPLSRRDGPARRAPRRVLRRARLPRIRRRFHGPGRDDGAGVRDVLPQLHPRHRPPDEPARRLPRGDLRDGPARAVDAARGAVFQRRLALPTDGAVHCCRRGGDGVHVLVQRVGRAAHERGRDRIPVGVLQESARAGRRRARSTGRTAPAPSSPSASSTDGRGRPSAYRSKTSKPPTAVPAPSASPTASTRPI